MNEGWVCPRCGRVNAPYLIHCDCKPTYGTCNHQWVLTNEDTIGTHYQCKICGERKIESYEKYNGITFF